jgi:hypothetical protein
MAIDYSKLTQEEGNAYQDLLNKFHYATSDTISASLPKYSDGSKINKFRTTIMNGMAKRRHTIEQYLKKYPWIINELPNMKPHGTNSFFYKGNILKYKDLCRIFDEKYGLIVREASRIIYVIKDI